MDKTFVISIKTIIQTLLLLVGIYVLYRLGSILGVIFIALLISLSLEHTVQTMMKQTFMNRKLSRPLAVLLTYLFTFGILSIVITIGLDPVISQTQKLIQTLLRNQELLNFGDNFNFSASDFIKSFATTSGGVVTASISIFSNVTTIFSILILAVYLSIDWENIKQKTISLFSAEQQAVIGNATTEIEQNVGLWLRGQITLMIVIGVMSYIGLILIGVDFALALGLLSGLFEIVPILGPVLSAVVAALVAVVDSPIKALMVIGVFTLIQNLENNIIVPKLMQKVSGFSPIIILIALLVGSELFGIVGAIVAVPVLMIAAIIFKYSFPKEK